MAQDVRHVNMIDPATEQVYCHLGGEVAVFDGKHVDQMCWKCPFWGGLAGGAGVVCVYDDANATAPEVKYTKPSTAQAEAPEPVEDPNSVASADGIAAMEARVKMSAAAGSEEEAPAEGEATAEEAPAEEAPAEEEYPTEEAPAEEGAPAVPEKKKPPVPPGFKKSGVVKMRPATQADVVAALFNQKKD